MKGFIPHMFIGVGAKNCYFTLWETYLDFNFRGEQQVYSFYHKNLSQNIDEAIAKATEFAEKNGVPLKFDRDSLDQEMEQIKRANAEERSRRIREAEEQEEEYKVQQDAKIARQMEMIGADMIPFGQYLGKSFNDVPFGYLNWLMNGDFEEGTVIYGLKMRLLNRHAHRAIAAFLGINEEDSHDICGLSTTRHMSDNGIVIRAPFYNKVITDITKQDVIEKLKEMLEDK